MTVLTSHTVVSPGWVDLLATGLPAETTAVRCVRSWRGVESVLSGTTLRPVQDGTWRYLDHALPAALAGSGSVSYRVEPLGEGGGIITEGVQTLSVAPLVVDHSTALLSDPLDPLGGLSVTVGRAGDLAWSSSSGEVLGPAMGGLPVSAGMVRQREHTLTVKTSTVADAGRVWAMIERGGVLLLRGDPSCLDHPTGLLYLHVPAPTRTMLRGPHESTRRWTIAGTEVAAPARLALVATRSYADTTSDFTTYAATLAALPTYLDRSRGEVV